MAIRIIATLLIYLGLCSDLLAVGQAGSGELQFDDAVLAEELKYPDWFKTSFGDLRDDVREAREAGKAGLIVYYGQKRCAYCGKLMQLFSEHPDIARYIQQYYDVVPVDIWGVESIIDTDGKEFDERELSLRYDTNFTPSLVFYDLSGQPVYRVRGYYPPYRFKAVLNYVTEGFYQQEKFSEYLARAEPDLFFQSGDLIERDFFEQPPYDLRQLLSAGDKPLAVFFEAGQCHACEVLHSGPLSTLAILKEMPQIRVVQLHLAQDDPVITPDGRQLTTGQWARELDIFYAPTILFFAPDGGEVIRLDSVVQFYRLSQVLNYVINAGYRDTPNFQNWLIKQRELSR